MQKWIIETHTHYVISNLIKNSYTIRDKMFSVREILYSAISSTCELLSYEKKIEVKYCKNFKKAKKN